MRLSRRAMILVANTAHSATKYRPGSAMTLTDSSNISSEKEGLEREKKKRGGM